MNPITWVEVPVSDISRAVQFYNTLLGWNLREVEMGPLKMAWFPVKEGEYGVGGSLVENQHYTPSKEGALVYFYCDDIDVNMSRVEEAGGKVLRGKTFISADIGYMGLLIDTEGNRIALHSNQ